MQRKMLAFPSKEEIREIKKRFKPGVRVTMDHMCITPTPIPDGTKGTVKYVDDAGTIHCLFDNGKSYGMSLYSDCFYYDSDGKDDDSDSIDSERKQEESIPSTDDSQLREFRNMTTELLSSAIQMLRNIETLMQRIESAENEKWDKRVTVQHTFQESQRSAPQEER